MKKRSKSCKSGGSMQHMGSGTHHKKRMHVKTLEHNTKKKKKGR